MKLADLLVSYKQVSVPKPDNIEILEDMPSTKYQRMLEYLNSKKPSESTSESSSETPQQEGFIGWDYSYLDSTPQTSQSQTSQPQQTSQPRQSSTNNVQQPKAQMSSNRAIFEIAFDEVAKSNTEANKYRKFLTQVAERESGFRQRIQNRAGAPAWGYFQFMQSNDGKYNNIRHYANTNIQTFLNDPKIQINAAIKLARDFENSITSSDKRKALAKGLDLNTEKGKNAALHAMWLAGPKGFRNWLNGGNPSDRKWSKNNAGTSVQELINRYNT